MKIFKKGLVCIKNNEQLTKYNYGFSLLEMMIATGILSAVVVLFSTSMVELKKTQVGFDSKNESMIFFNDLSTNILSNQDTCTSMLEGTRLTPEKSNFELRNITNLPGKTTFKAGDTLAGSKSNSRVRLRSLTITEKTDVPATRIQTDGTEYFKKTAEIELVPEQHVPGKQDNTTGSYIALPPKKIEVSVYVTPDNIIKFCQLKLNKSDVCNTMGSNLDGENTSQCAPAEQCSIRGSFITSDCNPSKYATGLCNPDSRLGMECQAAPDRCMPGTVNPITEKQTCPEGTSRTKTGRFTQSFEVSCGKKCSRTVTNTVEFFTCTLCP